jgi:signal peptide peptidase SppA
MNYQLVSAIIKNKWAIDPQFALQCGGMISDILAGNVEVEKASDREKLPVAAVYNAKTNSVTYYNWDNAPEGSIAIIKLMGPLMKNDQVCGPTGMATIGKRIQEAADSPKISAILIHGDTPGGTVDGTETLGDIIGSTKQKKPVLMFVDGLLASAGLWIGSEASEIWASTEHDEIGSVGVLSSFVDLQPAYELMGVKFHTITATQSKDKTRMYEDLRKGIYDEYRNEFLNPYAQQFINTIKKNRPAAEEKHLTGKMFFAKDVMGVFVDKIGNFNQAVARAAELGAQNKTVTNKTNKKSMKNFNKVNAVLKVDKLESADDKGVYLNEDQLAALEAELTANAASISSANTAKTAAETAKQTAEAAKKVAEDSLTAANAELDKIDASVAGAKTITEKVSAVKTKLAEKPGAGASNPKGEDTNHEVKGEDWATIDKLPHNLAADENL